MHSHDVSTRKHHQTENMRMSRLQTPIWEFREHEYWERSYCCRVWKHISTPGEFSKNWTVACINQKATHKSSGAPSSTELLFISLTNLKFVECRKPKLFLQNIHFIARKPPPLPPNFTTAHTRTTFPLLQLNKDEQIISTLQILCTILRFRKVPWSDSSQVLRPKFCVHFSTSLRNLKILSTTTNPSKRRFRQP